MIVVDDDYIQLSASAKGARRGEPIDIVVNGESVTQILTFETETIVQTAQSLYGDAGNDTLTVDLSFNYVDYYPPNSETITFNLIGTVCIVIRAQFNFPHIAVAII